MWCSQEGVILFLHIALCYQFITEKSFLNKDILENSEKKMYSEKIEIQQLVTYHFS